MVDSKNPKFWREWLRESLNLERLYGYQEKFYYAWLPGTMDEEEVQALNQAATNLGLRVVVDNRGAGEVIRG